MSSANNQIIKPLNYAYIKAMKKKFILFYTVSILLILVIIFSFFRSIPARQPIMKKIETVKQIPQIKNVIHTLYIQKPVANIVLIDSFKKR